MQVRTAFFALLVSAAAMCFNACSACNIQPSNPQQVREKTAEATAELKENAKAVAQGIHEGLARPTPDKPLNINNASKAQLMSLPGIDDATADRIINGRPYSSEHELLEKRIVSRQQYNQVADSITVKR